MNFEAAATAKPELIQWVVQAFFLDDRNFKYQVAHGNYKDVQKSKGSYNKDVVSFNFNELMNLYDNLYDDAKREGMEEALCDIKNSPEKVVGNENNNNDNTSSSAVVGGGGSSSTNEKNEDDINNCT